MQEVWSIYTDGVWLQLELFLYRDETLRQFVVYTYYDKDEQPLYVGCSKAYYDADYFNSERLPFFDEVKYVSFAFFENEEEMKAAKKLCIRARNPKHNKAKYKDIPVPTNWDEENEELVVLRKDMLQVWYGEDGEE